VSYLDRIWTMTPEGKQAKAVTTTEGVTIEREPAWSPDGNRIAFAADRGDGFDIFVVTIKNGAAGGVPVAATQMGGDERWPSWTADGRLVFSHRDARPAGKNGDPSLQYDIYLGTPLPGSESWQTPVPLTETEDSETYPRVSPDGLKVAFVSERDSEDDLDLWWMPVPAAAIAKPIPLGARPPKPVSSSVQSAGTDGKPLRANRITRVRGHEAYPSWAPDNSRVAFYAVREGIGSVWVATAEPPRPEPTEDLIPRAKPAAQPQLVSRRGGAPAWSPDGKTLLVTGLPDPEPVYNGNPLRNETEAPPLFALNAAFQLWRVVAPLPVHEDGGAVPAEIAPSPALFGAMFDRVWTTLKSLYYSSGSTGEQWASARDKFRPRATVAKNEAELETVIDEMVAAQPLIKPVITSNGAVIVSGHPLASEAGRLAFEKGGNVVDAMIAVSFALGVVEPEASGVGGDGSAVLYLKGMKKPTTIDYKDMTPIKATPDNPQMVQDGRIIAWSRCGSRLSLSQLRQRQGEVGGSRRAGDHAGGRWLHSRRGSAVEHRRRPPLPRQVAGGEEDLFAERQGAAPGRSILQQGLRDDIARHSEGRRRRVLQGRDREENRRRHGRERRHPHVCRSRAVSRHRARADRGALSRPHAVRRRPAAVDGHSAVRIAARARELSAEGGRARIDGSRLSPLLDRIVESARSASPCRRSGTLAR
jgi:hypothetical protein